jgi:hypothetical protein
MRIPTSKDVLGALGIDDVSSTCAQCHGFHDKKECPVRFYLAFREPLPGYTDAGERNPAAWLGDEPAPATLAALRAYFRHHGIEAGPTGTPAFVHHCEECDLTGSSGVPRERFRRERSHGTARGGTGERDVEAGGDDDGSEADGGQSSGGDGDGDGARAARQPAAHAKGHSVHSRHKAAQPAAHANGHSVHSHHKAGAAASPAATHGSRKATAAAASHAQEGKPHGGDADAAASPPPAETGLLAAVQEAIAAAVAACSYHRGCDPAAAAGWFAAAESPSPVTAV